MDDNGKLLSIGKFAKKLGVTPETLRRMQERGELKPCYISNGGTRYYSLSQLNKFLNPNQVSTMVAGYCRVSNSSQRDSLNKQEENVKSYMIAKGYRYIIIKHIGNEYDCKNEELQGLLKKINEKEISKIIILNKDVISLPGFDIIKCFCRLNNVEIEMIDKTKQNGHKEEQTALKRKIIDFSNDLFERKFNRKG